MRFVAMSEDQAKWIAYQWKYEGAYSFFHDAKQKDMQSFLEVGKKNTRQFAVYDEDQIIGFIGAKSKEEDAVQIAPGMRPELKGQGRGKQFLQACVAFLKEEMGAERITLSVASANEQALHVYAEAGFEKVGTSTQEVDGEPLPFTDIEYRMNS